MLAAGLLASCAVPQLDRQMLQAERAPVRLEGARGPLGRAESERILAALKQRAPNSGLLERHIAVEEAIAGNRLNVGNQVTLLEDGRQTYAAMLQAIHAAKASVHMESYIFESDEVGQEFADALKERKRAGVTVRLVVDGVGSIGTPIAFFQDLADAGVEVAIFNPVNAGTVLAKGLALQKRDHRKLMVVDGRVAFLGGINISGVYTPEGVGAQRGGAAGSAGGGDRPFDQRPWRDTQVRVEGPVVEDFQKGFLAIWARVTGEKAIAGPAVYPALTAKGSQLVRAVEGSPTAGANAMYMALVSAISNAEQRVTITMAYFVPHDALLEALEAAARRGVDVRILLPSRTDNWLVLYAGRAYYEDLLEAGVKLYERENRLLHAKTATIDGVWSTVGSTNLDWRSLVYNEELNAVVLGPEFAAQLERDFANDLSHSKAITREGWAQRPLADRMREAAARAWAQLL